MPEGLLRNEAGEDALRLTPPTAGWAWHCRRLDGSWTRTDGFGCRLVAVLSIALIRPPPRLLVPWACCRVPALTVHGRPAGRCPTVRRLMGNSRLSLFRPHGSCMGGSWMRWRDSANGRAEVGNGSAGFRFQVPCKPRSRQNPKRPRPGLIFACFAAPGSSKDCVMSASNPSSMGKTLAKSPTARANSSW